MLRFAYATPLDAMGRYLTKTEIDYLLAIAFGQAGMPDSSAVYRERVQLAWKDGDPEVKARLDSLATLTGRFVSSNCPSMVWPPNAKSWSSDSLYVRRQVSAARPADARALRCGAA